MPKRLSLGTIILPASEEKIIELCESKHLIGYETEIIVRIYWYKQSLNYIAHYMEFDKYMLLKALFDEMLYQKQLPLAHLAKLF